MSDRGSVIVIGGGPAGAVAAGELAARGFAVTVVEAKSFPRAKVCGEFVSPAAGTILEAFVGGPAGPCAGAERLTSAGAHRTRAFVLQEGDRSVRWTMPGRGAWVLSRRALDVLLLDIARERGARVLQPERIETVEYTDSGVRVALRSGGVLEADLVVHADGSGRFDPAGATPSRPGVVGLKCHLSPAAGHGPELRMRAARGAYIGSVGVEQGGATVALVARARLLRDARGDRDALLEQLMPAFRPEHRDGPWLSCGVAASGYQPPGATRSVRLGNAAAAVEPVGGEGIGLAVWSAAAAARLLDETDLSVRGLARFQAEFARAYRRRLRVRHRACAAAAAVLERPAAVRAMWPLLERRPGLAVRPFYLATGKLGAA